MENAKLDKIKQDLKAKQVSVIKEAVRQTFEKLEVLEREKNDVQNKIKILKHDLFDLKDGRLDRVLERQLLIEEVKSISVVLVSKVEVPAGNAPGNASPWYEEYLISVLGEGGVIQCNLNNSITKTYASGSFKLKNGEIKHL